jgi:transcriptional regulator with GAF, ATPase, and Fis domain
MASSGRHPGLAAVLDCTSDAPEALERSVRGALAREHIAIRDPARATGEPCVIVAAALSPGLLAALPAACRASGQRVLVVLPERGPLVDPAVWGALRAGAADVLAWAAGDDAVVERLRRWAAVDELMASTLVARNVIGDSPALRAAIREVVEVARFTESALLVTGESGTGKELVARLVHGLDPVRRRRQLVVVDCTTVVPALSGSEFFGHERGSFTGAVAARDGAFALADGGTLFLDEVGELPLALQAELLRVVQERTYKRVGSNHWRTADFRLVCATNRDLMADEADGRFRRDLYFRIAEWRCHLPPLRERPQDVLPLARHFLAELGEGPGPDLDPAVRTYLCRRAYPGNVRELRQLVRRLHGSHVGSGPITVGEVPAADRDSEAPAAVPGGLDQAVEAVVATGIPLKEIVGQVRATAVRAALAASGGSVAGSAHRLGITDRAVQMHLRNERLRAAGTEPATQGQAPDTETQSWTSRPPPPSARSSPST